MKSPKMIFIPSFTMTFSHQNARILEISMFYQVEKVCVIKNFKKNYKELSDFKWLV